MQSDFAAALKTSEVPSGLDAGRFAVYRNNRAVALADSLAATFAATQKIVGEEFFRAMAQDFANAHPPRSAVLHEYGAGFPGFVAGFEPAAELPYLSDVARIEWLWSRAYHAANADAITPETLARLDADALSGTRLLLHPSLSVLRSAHPAATIWEMNSRGESAPIDDWRGEDAAVARCGLAVIVRRLSGGEAAFLQALLAGETLGTAHEIAAAEAADFDPARLLAFLIGGQLIASLRTDPAS